MEIVTNKSGKHFLADAVTLTKDSLRGLVSAYEYLKLDESHKVVYVSNLASIRSQQVTLFSGGGSGHEPAHSGYVGPGLLSAAVVGHVFASPSSSQVLSCLRRTYSKTHGTIVIVMNYSGDIFNFARAIERFKTEQVNAGDSLPKVEMVVVGDDIGVVSQNDEENAAVGRRGVAGTVLVNKIAGAAASRKYKFEDVMRVASYTSSNIFTLGCALNSASVPGQGIPRELKHNEIEIGMGIHNEPGYSKESLVSADILIPRLIRHIVESSPARKVLDDKKYPEIVLFVNNLGGTSNLEMGLVTKLAVDSATSAGLSVARVFSGTYMSGLAMPGISISVFVLPGEATDTANAEKQEILDLIADQAFSPGWICHPMITVGNVSDEESDNYTEPQLKYNPTSDLKWEKAIISAYEEVVRCEAEITRLDAELGDGDAGVVLLAGATAVSKAAKEGKLPLKETAAALAQISSVVEDSMGGTSGIIYCLFLDGLSQNIRKLLGGDQQGEVILNAKLWGKAMVGALDTLYQYTSARPGHCTLIDALAPFSQTLANTGDVNLALKAAVDGSNATANMKPMRGRAVYTGKGQGLRDAGAVGLVSVLKGIVSAL
jgi:dihydroxyacetone kinase